MEPSFEASSLFMQQVSVVVIFSLLLIFLLKRTHQPYFIGYILAGFLLGPDGLNLVNDRTMIKELGNLGLVLLMFFVGAEMDPTHFKKNITRSVVGTFVQLLLSFTLMWVFGLYYDWDFRITLFFSFVISLSSTAIVFQYLMQNKLLNTRLGLLVGGILILQDILFIPMILSLHLLSLASISMEDFMLTILGSMAIVFFFWAILRYKFFYIPFRHEIKSDHELQVLVAFFLCFGFAWITNAVGLSSALGAFLAGILVNKDRCNTYLTHALLPFRVFFLSFFFFSIGLQLQWTFIKENFQLILLLTSSIILLNSLVNVVVFKLQRFTWREAFYAGALLSQIGEFSFILAQIAIALGLIDQFEYLVLISTITLTMIMTTPYITIVQKLVLQTSVVHR